MKNDFICPYCSGHLNIKDKVVFVAKKINGETGIIFLHPKLGDYSSEMHETFNVSKGEDVDILCPICHQNLKQKVEDKNFVHLLLVEEDGKRYNVLFSSIFGEYSTFKIGKEVFETFGKPVQLGINFETLSFLK